MRIDFQEPDYRPRLDLHRVAEAIMAAVLCLIVMAEVLP
jgi:hypothetical protein